jgi:NO-binding membrane sensor protein with MHYT domain
MDFTPMLIAIAVVVVLASWFVLHAYNRLVRMRNNVRNAWAMWTSSSHYATIWSPTWWSRSKAT